MMHIRHLSVLSLAALLAALSPVTAGCQTAAEMPADAAPESQAESTAAGPALGTSTDPLAIQGTITLTQGEIDAAFNRIAPEHRLMFVRSGERVDQLIRALLQNKLLAAEAQKAGFDLEPLASKRMALAAEKELADAWLDRVMEQAPDADYEALAHESYLANPEAWQSEEMVDVTHLLISSENKSADEALELAASLRARLEENPAEFDALVEEYSEDPSKHLNQGRFPRMKRGEMVAPFEEVAFALANEGEISQPVATTYGYHLIRLNRKMPRQLLPFEQVREKAIEQVRKEHVAQYRSNYLRKVLGVPIELPEGAVDAMVKRYFGENLELAPEFKD
jgi:peptidyl-prolyl cis-trans isomerase C